QPPRFHRGVAHADVGGRGLSHVYMGPVRVCMGRVLGSGDGDVDHGLDEPDVNPLLSASREPTDLNRSDLH
ncbi:MAG: hypothetical protein ACKN9D_16285, partial [Actinomycetales bacterium]